MRTQLKLSYAFRRGSGAWNIKLEEGTNDAENLIAITLGERGFLLMRGKFPAKDSIVGETLLKEAQTICPVALNLFNIHPHIYLLVEHTQTAEFLFALFLRDEVILWSETPKARKHARERSEEGLRIRASRKNIDKAVKILSLITQPHILNLKLQELFSFSHLFLASLFFHLFGFSWLTVENTVYLY